MFLTKIFHFSDYWIEIIFTEYQIQLKITQTRQMLQIDAGKSFKEKGR